MVASLRPFSELTRTELSAWRELAARAAEPNPFFEPEFLLPSVRHLGPRTLALAVVERDGAWLAAAPVRTLLRRIWVHSLCFLGTPLVDRDAIGEGVNGLIALLRPRMNPLVMLDTIGLDGPVATALAPYAPDKLVAKRWTRAAIDLRGDGEWHPPSSKARAELRRRRRRLGEELGGEVVVHDVTEQPGAVDSFLALESSGWKGAEGTALGADPAQVALFSEVCAAFTDLGRLELLALGTEERTVAMACNLAAGDAVFGFKIAYDEAYRRQGPGALLIADVAERFATNGDGHRLLDSCASAGGAHLDKVMPDRRPVATVVLGTGLVGKAAGAALRAGLAARARSREALAR